MAEHSPIAPDADPHRLEAEYRDAAANTATEAEALEWIEWAPDEALD